MPQRIAVFVVMVLCLALVLLIFSAGCKGRSGEEQPSQVEMAATPPPDTADGDAEEEEPEEPLLTQEEVESIAGYGPFVFPDSQLIAERSRHQELPAGGEIYNLVFGASVSPETAADWYKDHLESGTEKGEGELVNGRFLYGFSYESPDKSWSKNVTVRGVAGDNVCMIQVNLMRIPKLEKEEEGGDEDSSTE